MSHRFQCLSCGGQYAEASGDGLPYVHVCEPMPAEKNSPERERPDKRDENPDGSHDGELRGIRAEGKGVKCLTDKRLQEPRWISALKARAPKEDDDDAA